MYCEPKKQKNSYDVCIFSEFLLNFGLSMACYSNMGLLETTLDKNREDLRNFRPWALKINVSDDGKGSRKNSRAQELGLK